MSDHLHIRLDDSDAKAYLDSETWETIRPKTLVLGEESIKSRDDIVRELVPRIMARKLERIIPAGYSVTQISMKVHVGGKIVGVGVEGEVTVVFGPAPTSPG